jgi:hypothetical protein
VGEWRNRRDILRSVASAGLLSLVAAPARGHADGLAPSTASLYKVAFDDRHPAGRAFGMSMAAAGYDTTPLGDDVTNFWYHDLHHQWQNGPAAIAGLTSLRAAFCLEGLAGDVWMRCVYRGEHYLALNGAWRHRLQGSDSFIAALERRAEGWGTSVARIVRTAAGRRMPLAKPLANVAAPYPAGAAEPLISWLIAPSHRS